VIEGAAHVANYDRPAYMRALRGWLDEKEL
jgi:hypothetical protein